KFGNTVYNLSVTKNGDDIDEQAFIAEYTELTKLEMDGRLPKGFTPQEKSEFSIIIKYDGGKRTLEFYPFDPLHYALSLDGVFLHYVSIDKLNELKL
ncbi:MAG: hypothetical protein Q4E07_06070, partial [Eubacteriales bacterium]|nr:hypothetical protein [Eubacteriales bacterium]